MKAKPVFEFEQKDNPLRSVNIGIHSNKMFDETDPFLTELQEALEEVLEDRGQQNYELTIDFSGPEDNKISTISINIGCNADFEDEDGRHPWMDIDATIDLFNKTIEVHGGLESKSGSIDVSDDEEGTFDEYNVEEIAEAVHDLVEEVGDNIYNLGENAAEDAINEADAEFCDNCGDALDDDDIEEGDGLCYECREEEDEDEDEE
jgi:hypothetical protein